MRRAAAILSLVAVVSLLGASDVRGGAALTPAGKTTGPGVIATIVTDVTNPPGPGNPGKGLTTIRVQKASASAAVIFYSSYVNSLVDECISPGLDLKGTTANRFTGLINGFVDSPGVLDSLLQNFGNPSKAAITSQDYVACTPVTYKDALGNVLAVRQILSFTAVIQFQP
jgi:hypothetical protein